MQINKFILVLVFIFCVSTAFAKRQIDLDSVLRKMKMELKLTDEQVDAIKPIVKESLERRQEVIENLQGDVVFNKSTYKREMLKLKDEENEQLSKVLTPKQMKTLINRQHIKESLNKDQIDFSEGLSSGVGLHPEGGSFAF